MTRNHPSVRPCFIPHLIWIKDVSPWILAGIVLLLSALSASAASEGQIINLSARLKLPASGVIITGFVVSGEAPQSVLVRAVGP